MADPILDESFIIHLLSAPVQEDHVNVIQSGAVQTLVDMYDRHATREHFIEHASTCFALYGQASKLWILRNIETAFDRGKLTTEQFAIAREGIANIMRKQTADVIDIVKQLQECPTSQDRIH